MALSRIYQSSLPILSFHFQINRTKRRFENIAFHKRVNRVIKQKIESISNLSEKAGFTCFDWFLLDPYTGLKVGEVIQTYFLENLSKQLNFCYSRSPWNSWSAFCFSSKLTTTLNCFKNLISSDFY